MNAKALAIQVGVTLVVMFALKQLSTSPGAAGKLAANFR